MEVGQVLHMNKGTGETSYAKNSSVQNKIICVGEAVTDEAIEELIMCSNFQFPMSMRIADLGCSSGPNTLSVISKVMEVVYTTCRRLNRPAPEFSVFLNDLFTNDFNHLFGLLPAFYDNLTKEKGTGFGPCFVSGVPGSFYGRLFPSNTLHFVHSSSSLHWLSQVPVGLGSDCGTIVLNKGKLYISKSSPPSVLEAYSLQFQKDFSEFLKSRSEEMVAGGRMVLSFMGRKSMDPTTEDSCYQWELLAQALMSMVSEGLIEEERVDSFNAPYYAPCIEELKLEVEKEGSFAMYSHEAFEIEWDGGVDVSSCKPSSGERVAKTIRAVVESMLESQFGNGIMDELFTRYGVLVGDHLSKTRTKYINLVISLVK
ncbi:Jasmonate O-methyltransferase [Quillaja saponaria]|uniref:Jasmonate O-methyltransferase n=1 Tax=Quillaja saponaria TaxID=32244 RepID=A0AAD7PJC8_QUISA|nr:Jasmonate O-methyltransferase [Quillaja saponaria]